MVNVSLPDVKIRAHTDRGNTLAPRISHSDRTLACGPFISLRDGALNKLWSRFSGAVCHR